jgi:hypothetical protein
VSPVKYELGFYIPDDDILHSHCREHVKCEKGFRNRGTSSLIHRVLGGVL